MQNLLNFIPVALFFIVYKWQGDIKHATVALMIATTVQLGLMWWRSGRLKPIHWVTLVLVLSFGSATLLLNDTFIVWKPTVLNAMLALVFLLSPLFGSRQPLIKIMMGKEIVLPLPAWQRLNLAWGIFFILLAILNIAAYWRYGMDFWVSFHFIGILGLTALFILAQGIWLARHGTLADKTAPKTEHSDDAQN